MAEGDENWEFYHLLQHQGGIRDLSRSDGNDPISASTGSGVMVIVRKAKIRAMIGMQ